MPRIVMPEEGDIAFEKNIGSANGQVEGQGRSLPVRPLRRAEKLVQEAVDAAVASWG